MNAMSKPSWIAVDWGTTRLRAFAMTQSHEVMARGDSDKGMATLCTQEFEPALLELITPWLDPVRVTPVIACGMVGARQGWIEAPYRKAPCPPFDAEMVQATARDPRIQVSIVSGISQTDPADVMRGEETQIAGFLAGNPEFDGVLCLPGTHTKWVLISAGEIVSFVTYMTGEMFGLLSRQSVLRHTIGTNGWDDDAFGDALSDAISKPQFFAARLFSLRATSLLSDISPGSARARLSGTLIGIELAAAKGYWLGQNIAVIGAAALSKIYVAALRAQGANAEVYAAQDMTLAGLSAAYAQLETTP